MSQDCYFPATHVGSAETLNEHQLAIKSLQQCMYARYVYRHALDSTQMNTTHEDISVGPRRDRIVWGGSRMQPLRLMRRRRAVPCVFVPSPRLRAHQFRSRRGTVRDAIARSRTTHLVPRLKPAGQSDHRIRCGSGPASDHLHVTGEVSWWTIFECRLYLSSADVAPQVRTLHMRSCWSCRMRRGHRTLSVFGEPGQGCG